MSRDFIAHYLRQTAAALTTFMLAIVLHPEVMRSAQAQIDAVVGHDRLPTANDRDKLPYFAAIVKEVLRWSPVTPLAIPKRSTKACSLCRFSLVRHVQ